MKKEIKFRAWDIENTKMINWENIHIEKPKDFDELCVWVQIDDSIRSKFGNVELMQYTGLKDKNGVEIYESDIVLADCRNSNVNQSHYIIRYDNTNTCFYGDINGLAKNKFEYLHCQPICDIRQNIEVIGNIYEHPHLLEA